MRIQTAPLRTALLLALAVAMPAFLAGCQSSSEAAVASDKEEVKKDKDPLIPVEAVVVARRSVSAAYSGTATLEAEREAQVVAKASGTIVELMVEEGDKVRAGQVLARLDSDRQQLEVERLEAMLNRLENDLRRSKELFEKRLTSSEAHERARFDLAQQQAAYDLAKLDLSYTRIIAPFDGVITQRLVKEGNLVQVHQPLFRLDDFDPLLAVLNVPERELRTLKPGMTVAMQVDALPGHPFEGTIARVSPVVDSGTGTFRVTAEFRDSSEQLAPGMFGRLGIVYDTRASALVVPREAVMSEDGEDAVYRVIDQEVTRTPVRLGYVSGGDVEIVSGLEEGDWVVTAGKHAIRNASKVEVVNAAALGTPPAGPVLPADETTAPETAVAQVEDTTKRG